MIKELKVNFYRMLRTKSFYVILILLVLGALFAAVELKFCADDPLGFFESIKETLDESVETEEDRQSFQIIFNSIDQLAQMNSLSGVVRMTLCSELVCFLQSIFVALFVAGEFKSRYHINHYSLNTHPAHVVFMEWLSLISTIVIVELLCYGATLGLSVALCNSFRFDDAAEMLKIGGLMMGVIIASATFAFMIAYLRKAAPLAIVLSSLFTFGVFDIVFTITSIWVDWTKYLALSSIVTTLGTLSLSMWEVLGAAIAVIIYTALFLGVTLFVASKRDPY